MDEHVLLSYPDYSSRIVTGSLSATFLGRDQVGPEAVLGSWAVDGGADGSNSLVGVYGADRVDGSLP